MKYIVVYNPKSGSAKPKTELKSLFKAAGIEVDSFITMDESLDKNLKSVSRKGTAIAAIGGDGTIASVAASIHGTGAILAPLPGGTLNHFTKDAGITQDLDQAIKNIATGTPRKIDVATVNGTLFLNNSSIGIYPTTLQSRKRFEDTLGKWPAAIVSGVRALARFRIYTVTIKGITHRTPFIFVGNNHYDIDATGERKKLNDGKLSIYIIKSDKRRTIARILFASIFGRARQEDDLLDLSQQKIIIHSPRKSLKVSTDGELISVETPITYEVLAGSLTILS